jgi:hypothetical protein
VNKISLLDLMLAKNKKTVPWIKYIYAGSGKCDRFCSNISVLAGLPMMP